MEWDIKGSKANREILTYTKTWILTAIWNTPEDREYQLKVSISLNWLNLLIEFDTDCDDLW